MNAPVDVASRIYAHYSAGRRKHSRAFHSPVELLDPGVIHGCIGTVDYAAKFDQLARLRHLLWHIEDCHAALQIFTVTHERDLDRLGGDARNCHDTDEIIFKKRLDSGSFSRS